MSSGRRRKKAARQQSVAQWRATTTVAPQRAGDHQGAPRPVPVAERVGAPVAGLVESPASTTGRIHDGTDVDHRVADDAAQDEAAQDEVVRHEAVRDEAAAADPGPGQDDQEDYEEVFEEEGFEEDEEEPKPRFGRRLVVVVAVAAPLMFAGGYFAVAWALTQIQDQPSRPASAAISPPVLPSPRTAVSSPPADTETTEPEIFVPGRGVGPGLTTPGALVQASPMADGTLEVVERIRFADPVSELSLGLPLTKGVAARSMPGDVEVADLQVQADDAVVDLGATGLTRPRTVDLPGDTSSVVMRYRLTGATIRSIPSTPGRALTVLPPITSPATLGTMPFVIEVSGAQVTNVLCPGLPAAVQLCGRTWTQGWYSPPQEAGRTAVLVQINLPEPVSN